jgi:hypothetical protein
MELNRKNWKRIKVKGKCPVCGSKVEIGCWQYHKEPWTMQFCPICTNDDCNESYGYGGNIKIRFINHRTVKVDELWD